VAQEGGVGVGGVRLRLPIPRGAVGLRLGAWDREERARNIALQRRHASQPRQAAAAQPVHNDGLSLVVARVSDADTPGTSLARDLTQEGVAGTAGGILQRAALVAGDPAYIYGASDAAQTQPLCERAHPIGVPLPQVAAQPVVERGDDERPWSD